MLEACRAELRSQQELVAGLVEEQLRPALRNLGTPILDVGDLDPAQRDFLARYFADAVEPILIPLAADAAHPFPFISNLGLNVAVLVTGPGAATAVSCGSRCRPTRRDGCRCRTRPAGCRWSR